MKIVLSFICLLFSTGIYCQFDQLHQWTSTVYGSRLHGPTWAREMKGKMDDRYEINLYIVTDKKQFYGAYQVKTSNEIFLIEGAMDKKGIQMIVVDTTDTPVGTIYGDMSDKEFYGVWRDVFNHIEMSFTAYEVNYLEGIAAEYSWIRGYKSEDEETFILSKIADSYVLKGNISNEWTSLTLECIDDQCHKLTSSYIDDDEATIERTVLIQDESILITDGQRKGKAYSLIGELSIVVEDISGTHSRMYSVHPSLTDKKLARSWNIWYNDNIVLPVDHDQHDEIYDLGIDIEVDFFSDRFISGVVVFQDNLAPEIGQKSFIIDLEKKRVKSTPEFFIKDFDYHSLIAPNRTTKIAMFQDHDFNICSLHQNGLLVRSPFNTIYGVEKVLIPYAQLNNGLKLD